MKYDDILATIGEFGLYQKIIFILASFCTLFAPMNVVIQVFSAGKTDHWCDVQDLWENCTSCLGTDVDCEEAMRNISLPIGDDGMVDQCNRYDIKMADGNCSDLVLPQLQDEAMNYSDYIVPCDHGWIYDTSQYKSTIVCEFDLVCNKQRLPNFAQTVFFAGTMAGSVFFGSLSDRFGRRVGLFSSTAATGVFGILVFVSQSFTMYTIMRFFLGASTYSTFVTAFVLVSEIVAPSKRVFTGIIIEFFFAFGIMLLAIAAFFIRTWRILQLVTTLPGIATLALIPDFLTEFVVSKSLLPEICQGVMLILNLKEGSTKVIFVPESPRWLISQGRKDEASVIIRRTARINGVSLTNQDVQQMTKVDSDYPSQTSDSRSLIPLFKSRTMRWQTLNLLYVWFVQSLVYYGLTLSTGSLGVNIYAGFFFSGAVEIIGYGSVMYMIEVIGRRFSLAGYLLLVGISCILVMLTTGITKFVIGMIGKAAISGTFGIIYVYTAELYPTPLRAITVGICSMASKVGGMICPLVFILAFRWPFLPLSLFAAASIFAGATTLFLPETRRLPLPETLQEAEALSYRGRRPVPTSKKGLEKDYDDDELQ